MIEHNAITNTTGPVAVGITLAPVTELPNKFCRFGALALREWLATAETWSDPPPAPWDWNDIPLVRAVADDLERRGTPQLSQG